MFFSHKLLFHLYYRCFGSWQMQMILCNIVRCTDLICYINTHTISGTKNPKLCRLAPLKVCLPTVVTEFSRLSLRLGLLDSTTLPQEIGTQRCQRPLEMFFPFDPYLLRHSSQFLDLKHTFVRFVHPHISSSSYSKQLSHHPAKVRLMKFCAARLHDLYYPMTCGERYAILLACSLLQLLQSMAICRLI